MKVIKYSEFTLNESVIDSVRYKALLEEMDSTYLKMVQEGKTIDEINEGIWDIVSLFGDGLTDRLKNYAAGWLLKKMGLPEDNNFLSELAKNIVEEISFKKIGNYFGEGSCKYWVDAIVKGLAETLEEKLIDIIFNGIGLDVNFKSGIFGTAAGTIRETFTNYINSTEFANKLAGMLEGKVCGSGTSFSTVFGGGGEFTEKDLKKAASAVSNKTEGSNKEGAASKIWDLLGV